VILTNGEGVRADGTIHVRRRGPVEVTIDTVVHAAEPQAGPTLAIGVLAGSAMDLVVQKAVELGVLRLVPVCCRRSQLGLDRAGKRLDHWLRLSRQALKQCRREWAMAVSSPVTLPDLIDATEPGRGIVAHPAGGVIVGADRTTLLVGPEGGFTSDEEGALEQARWRRLRLGPHVLRAETAAIAGTAVLINSSS